MFGSSEQHGRFIASATGFPGVYPVKAVVSLSPSNRQATPQGTFAKASTEPNSGFGSGICNGGVSKVEQDVNVNDPDATSDNGGANGPGTITAGLPDVGERLVHVAEVETICVGDTLDIMFVPLSTEDRIRLSSGQSMANLFRELHPDFPESETERPGSEIGGQNEDGNEKVPMNMSDDEYMDQVFARLRHVHKERPPSSQRKESLLELLGDTQVYEGPSGCDEELKDVPSGPATNSPDATVHASPS
ncbi:hypothetical protein FGB62_150g02 [Gracilaria domingensis]|nr:hypothetical protein FGB62_150g02 [Gracilaria domingensis]